MNEAVLRTLLLAGVAATGMLSAGCRGGSVPTDGPNKAVVAPALSEAEIRDRDIEFYRERVTRDPSGAADLARLAALYLQRSRETGNPRDATRAEELSRKSMRARRSHNDAAAQVLASSLLAQHRFDEALHVALDIRDRNPDVPATRAAVAEIQMELGMYDSARVAFDSLMERRSDLAVVPRLARWAEIDGRPDDARRLMRHALAIARRDPRTPREQLAWFWLRTGDIELRAGRIASADSAYRAGLAIRADDHRLLAARARLAATERRWQDAIAHGEAAISQNLDPATLGILSDAYTALGDTARGREYAHTLDIAVRAQPGAYHRAWSLFLLDHGRQLATVHRKVREELKTRRDVYGYDLFAWSLYRQGRYADARSAMTKALLLGTRDAQLLYHAGRIEAAIGNAGAARALLDRAQTLDPNLR